MKSANRTPAALFGSDNQFSMAPAGRIAEASYRSRIATSRAQPNRVSFDAARLAWATSVRLEPDDANYLGELRQGAAKLSEIIEAMAVRGRTRADATAALERLLNAGLVLRNVDP